MPTQVRIIPVSVNEKKKPVTEQEQSLSRLLNEGWTIAAAGGGTGLVIADTVGFVILLRETAPR